MAEKMFLRLPELVEKLLVFLDTKSTLCLAIAHPFARESGHLEETSEEEHF